ncbi:MAG: hypothetical protein R3345_11160 [Fulvivirga sp.]|nr:hypothetical protein [Fulvivirga sp.]
MIKKGCGFIVISIIGFIGIGLLYFGLSPYFDLESSRSDAYIRGEIVDVFTVDNQYDSSLLNVVPVISYEYAERQFIDTAYHLSKTEPRLGYTPLLGEYHYKKNSSAIISVEKKEPSNYMLVDELPLDRAVQDLAKEWQTGLLIIGSIFTFIFLWGLSRLFRYRPPADRSQRF